MPAQQDLADPTADTIVAIATAPGRGGIGIVRLSGPAALQTARHLTQLSAEPQSHCAMYTHVLDREGRRMDDALLTWFKSPRSYTGEEVVEVATHGAPVILQAVVARALECGARLARPGEFTERAFLNHRLDLTQAEAVRDLIEAQTLTQAHLAAEQMGGSLARQIRPVKQELVELIAALEAGIDFAEDDLDTLPAAEVAKRIGVLLPPLASLLRSYAHGRLVREGLRIALIGKPNAGKSSLFNRLLERDRSIVTPTPGTTRDVVSEQTVIAGIPVQLLDTAGLRETEDEIERLGVARSREAAAEADLVLTILDASQPGKPGELSESSQPADSQEIEAHALRALSVWNKADLLTPEERASHGTPNLLVSALTGEGVDTLRSEILCRAGVSSEASLTATLTNLRQRDTIQRALHSLSKAQAAALAQTPHEMLLLDLYEGLHTLDELTGETTPDSILNTIFSTFCIGK